MCYLSQPARTFLCLKTASVAPGVGKQRRGSGFRWGSTRAQGLRPRPGRGKGFWRLDEWSLRTHWMAPWYTEGSSVLRLTRTPRKRPAGRADAWTQSPWCTWLLHNYFQPYLHALILFLVLWNKARERTVVCVHTKGNEAAVLLIKTSRWVSASSDWSRPLCQFSRPVAHSFRQLVVKLLARV